MRLWCYVGKGASFESGDGVGEMEGYGATPPSTIFDAYEDDVLGCDDA